MGIEINKIYCGDCVEIMQQMDDEFVDLTVTSPPYDNLREYNGYTFDFESIARQLYRVTKTGGVVVWVVADQTKNYCESLTSFKQAIFFVEQCGFNLLDTMIYYSPATGAKGSHLSYWQSFEYMFVFSKGKPKTVNRITDIKNPSGGKIRKPSHKFVKIGSRINRMDIKSPEYSVRPNIWRYVAGNDNKTLHPAPFPEKLANDHIISWSNPGDLVFDPMCGSGTSCKMAIVNHRNYIGVDCSQEYCDIAKDRIAVVQPKLI